MEGQEMHIRIVSAILPPIPSTSPTEKSRWAWVKAMSRMTAIDWLHSKGIRDIFLESGKDNHAAHCYFEKRGFVHVSEIYKLMEI